MTYNLSNLFQGTKDLTKLPAFLQKYQSFEFTNVNEGMVAWHGAVVRTAPWLRGGLATIL